MGYIGRNLANLSDRVVLDSITTSSTDTFTLQLNSVNFVPSSAESLTVSLNGVIQKPNSSYTVSSSTITFASSLSASDSIDFIIAERGITLQTPSAGSVGTSQLASTAVTTAKIADDAVTKDKVSNLMYPAFEAVMSADMLGQTDNVIIKVQFNSENFDTDSCYDATTNYRFTPTVAGKYYIYSNVRVDSGTVDKLLNYQSFIYKNGSQLTNIRENFGASALSFRHTGSIFATTTLNGTSDYIEIYAKGDVTSGSVNFKASSSIFGAYRIGD